MEPSVTPCAEPDPPDTTVCLMACSPHADGTSDAAARILEQALASRGVVVDRIQLRDWKVHPCVGCGYCHMARPHRRRRPFGRLRLRR